MHVSKYVYIMHLSIYELVCVCVCGYVGIRVHMSVCLFLHVRSMPICLEVFLSSETQKNRQTHRIAKSVYMYVCLSTFLCVHVPSHIPAAAT